MAKRQLCCRFGSVRGVSICLELLYRVSVSKRQSVVFSVSLAEPNMTVIRVAKNVIFGSCEISNCPSHPPESNDQAV